MVTLCTSVHTVFKPKRENNTHNVYTTICENCLYSGVERTTIYHTNIKLH